MRVSDSTANGRHIQDVILISAETNTFCFNEDRHIEGKWQKISQYNVTVF